MCGKYVQDCSCNPSCKLRGNCCFDFESRKCEDKLTNALDRGINSCRRNDGCELCDKERTLEDGKTAWCNQCNSDSYRHKGRCYKTCPYGTKTFPVNKICDTNSIINIIKI